MDFSEREWEVTEALSSLLEDLLLREGVNVVSDGFLDVKSVIEGFLLSLISSMEGFLLRTGIDGFLLRVGWCLEAFKSVNDGLLASFDALMSVMDGFLLSFDAFISVKDGFLLSLDAFISVVDGFLLRVGIEDFLFKFGIDGFLFKVGMDDFLLKVGIDGFFCKHGVVDNDKFPFTPAISRELCLTLLGNAGLRNSRWVTSWVVYCLVG